MEENILKESEKMLYTTQVALRDSVQSRGASQYNTELRLTNERIILITRTKKLLTKGVVTTEAHEIGDLKTYDGEPQIMKKEEIVNLYFSNSELHIEFSAEREAKIFTDTLRRLCSGQSKLVRNILKIKKEIKNTGDALDIDISAVAKTAAKIGLNTAMAVTGGSGVNKVSKIIGNIAQQVTEKDNAKDAKLLPDNDQIEMLKKYKQLLDDGAITQDEFDRMKLQIIGN